MTSFSNISRGLGAGLIGLSILTTLSVGGCGNSDSVTTGDTNGAGVEVQDPVRNQTRVVYEFTRNRLEIPNSSTVQFYDITLNDSSGAAILFRRFSAADSVQIAVPDASVSRVASTRIALISTSGAIAGQFDSSLTLQQGQTSLVGSGTLNQATLTSLKIRTSDEAGNSSIARTGSLQVLSGFQYPLVTIATYNVSGTTTETNITNANVTYTVSNTNVATVLPGAFLVQGPNVGANDKATLSASFGGKTGTLGLNITGLAAPSPTPEPSPSVQVSPTPVPTPTPPIGTSPTPAPSPTATTTPSPTPQVSATPVLISPTPTPLPATSPAAP